MFSFFKKPYPFDPFSKKDALRHFLGGCFIAFFLIVFEPFNSDEWQTTHKALKFMSFGFVSFLIPFGIKATTLIIKVDEEKWNIGKEILWILFVLLVIAAGNLLLARFIHLAHLSWSGFLAAAFVTVLVGIFPIIASVIYKYNRFLALNKKEAGLMETQVHDFQKKNEEETIPAQKVIPEKIILVAENEKEKFELLPEQLLYIESADNYSTIFYLEQEKIKKHLLRSSLKRIEQQIHHPYILRCHRSYITSLLHIDHINGNAQGYKINFKFPAGNEISVSRNYSRSLFERLETLK